jgi:DNA-3-methyladenine glycosylase II
MFTIGREDVFPVNDLGIQQAMCKLYNISSSDKKQNEIVHGSSSKKVDSVPHLCLFVFVGLERQ